MRFLIGISDLFYYAELCVSVEVVSVTVEMFARRNRVIAWFVCVRSVIIQPYVEHISICGISFVIKNRFVSSTNDCHIITKKMLNKKT